MGARILPRLDGSITNRTISGQGGGHLPRLTGTGSWHTRAGFEVFTDFDSAEFLERNVLNQAVEFIVGTGHHDGGAVAEVVVENKGGNSDEETTGRRHENFTDAEGERAGVGNTGRTEDGERPHHSDDRSQQSDHGSDHPDDGEVTILGFNDLTFPEAVFDQRRFYRIFTAADTFQGTLEDESDVGFVGPANFPSFLVISGFNGGTERLEQSAWCELLIPQIEEKLNDEGDHGYGCPQDSNPDHNDEWSTVEDGIENAVGLLGDHGFLLSPEHRRGGKNNKTSEEGAEEVGFLHGWSWDKTNWK